MRVVPSPVKRTPPVMSSSGGGGVASGNRHRSLELRGQTTVPAVKPNDVLHEVLRVRVAHVACDEGRAERLIACRNVARRIRYHRHAQLVRAVEVLFTW